jgi:hypothetical protein
MTKLPDRSPYPSEIDALFRQAHDEPARVTQLRRDTSADKPPSTDTPPSKYRMERITAPRKLRQFLTYDLEWYPNTYELRIVGVYDGSQYRSYLTIGDFIRGELTAAHVGWWFFAHAGGLADLPFVLEWMLRTGYAQGHLDYNLSGSFSGSSVTAMDIRKGKQHWLLLDSLWLLKDGLRNIAKSMGQEKGGEEEERDESGEVVKVWFHDSRTNADILIPKHHVHFYAPLAELREYNNTDCRLLWEAIDQFQLFLLERGGQLQRTYSSCAFHLFRRKYLTEEFDCYELVNQEAEEAYVASRVEVFNRYLISGALYDINSSFPYSMTKVLPGKLKRTSAQLPDTDDRPYLARCEVEVRPDQDLPPLPLRVKDRVFFPTGKWTAWLTGVDLQLLERTGGTIHQVHKCLEFYPWTDFCAFATDLFEDRMAAKLGCTAEAAIRRQCGRGCTTGATCQWQGPPNTFHALLLKYVLNGGYGKLAEKELKQGLIVNPPADKIPPRENMYVPGAFVVERQTIVRHRHLPASAYITAYSRRWIYEYLEKLERRYYCDTDSFACNQTQAIPSEWLGEELGQLKLEATVDDAEFVAPKVYRLGKKIRAKGFPRLTMSQWADLIEYKEIEIERMGRIKELYRIGEISPQDITIRKRLNPDSMPKRCTAKDGTTRPWTVTELYDKVLGGQL